VKKLYSDIDSQRSRVVARSITRNKGEKISLKQFEVSIFHFFQTRKRGVALFSGLHVFYSVAN
jgi:hypothetical protein